MNKNKSPQHTPGAEDDEGAAHRSSDSPNRIHNQYTPIWEGDQIVGEAIGKDFIKPVDSIKHYMRIYGGYSCGVESLENAKKAGTTHVKIIVDKGKEIFTAPITLFYSKGVFFNFPGYGDQYCLPLKYWNQIGGTTSYQPRLF